MLRGLAMAWAGRSSCLASSRFGSQKDLAYNWELVSWSLLDKLGGCLLGFGVSAESAFGNISQTLCELQV